MLPALFAVADGVQPGIFLVLDPQQRGIALGELELLAHGFPQWPQLVGLGQPERLRQAAGDGGGEQHGDFLPDTGRDGGDFRRRAGTIARSEEHTSELQSLMRISYAVFCLKKKKQSTTKQNDT